MIVNKWMTFITLKASLLALTLLVSSCVGEISVLGTKKEAKAYTAEYIYPNVVLNPGDGARVESPLSVKCIGPSNVEVDLLKCSVPDILPTKTFESPEGYGPSFIDSNGNTVRNYYGKGTTTAASSEAITCSFDYVFVNGQCQLPFRFKVNITNTGNYHLVFSSLFALMAKYDFTIDWGDGVSEKIINPTGSIPHSYEASVTPYTITIYGKFPAFNGSAMGTNLKNRIVEVSSLGDVGWEDLSGAFQNANNLLLFNARGDTSNVTNMSAMFSGASKVESLDLTSFNTSNVTDMSVMFRGTSKLNELKLNKIISGNLTGFDTSKVKKMNNMFYGTSELLSFSDITNFRTSEVVTMEGMFAFSSVNDLDLSNFETINVTTMKDMFFLSNIKKINISNFDTSNVVDFANMFSITQVKEINFPAEFKTGENATMSAMFSTALGLESLDLSSFDTSRVVNMNAMFTNSSILKQLNVSSFNTGQVRNMDSMFSGLLFLEELNISHFEINSANNVSSMLAFLSRLLYLDLSGIEFLPETNLSSIFNSVTKFEYAKKSKIDLSNVVFNVADSANSFFSLLPTDKGLNVKLEGTIFREPYTFLNSNNVQNFDSGINYYCTSVPTNLTGLNCLDPTLFPDVVPELITDPPAP